MLADASISRADVSKAKPLAPQPAIGHTHAGRRPQRGRQAVASTVAARHTNCRRPLPRRRAGARSPPRRGGPVRDRHRGEEGRRGRRAWRAAASRRAAASGTEMRVGDGEGGRRRGRARWRRETALRACRGGAACRGKVARRVGEEWRGASEKRGASGTGMAMRGGGEDGRVEEEQRDLGGND
jgi:hypothetical protein